MPEPQRIYNSSDIPEFYSYPASPDDAMGLLEDARAHQGLDIDAAARRVGEILGRAALVAIEAKNQLVDAKEEIFDQVDAATYRLRSQVTEAAENYSQLAQEKMEQARSRTRHLAKTASRDYPVQVILGAAATGLLIGAGLRAWRETRG